MYKKIFDSYFKHIQVPVIVVRDSPAAEVVYENQAALLYLNPFQDDQKSELPVLELLDIPASDFANMRAILTKDGVVDKYITKISRPEQARLPIAVSASRVMPEQEAFIVLYLDVQTRSRSREDDYSQALVTVLSFAYKSENIDEAIQNVIAYAGNYIDVNRSYIFESVSEKYTSNTYEWCSVGTEPAIDMLQDLAKDEYSYDKILSAEMCFTDDIRTMDEEDRLILEPQGIKALAVIPMFYHGVALGYVGFDDCDKYRRWSANEVDFLKELSEVLAALLVQRNTQNSLKYSLEIFQTITDNTDSLIYANDIHNYEILFANRNIASSLGLSKNELLGKKCYLALQRDFSEPCEFCPMKKMLDGEGNIVNNYYRWEFKNTRNGKWYLIRDQIIKWIDGRDVHIETATEITNRKEYESHLEYIASTDIMTGAYTREWGKKILQNILDGRGTDQENCLVFIDLDGLKEINDKYGHADGDFMIIKTLELIKANVRKSDVVCRWGGDEFILIIRANAASCEIVMNNIRKSVAAYNEKREIPFTLSFSYGIVDIWPNREQTIEELVTLADRKMYEQKKQKKTDS